jgi:hypothetical protein
MSLPLEALRDYLQRSRSRGSHSRTGAGLRSASNSSSASGAHRFSGPRASTAEWSIDALMEAARADNVVGILRPYLEALA